VRTQPGFSETLAKHWRVQTQCARRDDEAVQVVRGNRLFDLLLPRIAARVTVALRDSDIGQGTGVGANRFGVDRPRDVVSALANKDADAQVFWHRNSNVTT
jgi:hypothetical protein